MSIMKSNEEYKLDQLDDNLRLIKNNNLMMLDINKVDRDPRNFKTYSDLIQSGKSPRELLNYLAEENVHFQDYIYFLDVAQSFRRVDVYDEVLKLAFQRFGSNIHLAYHQARFGKLEYLGSDEVLKILLDSPIYKHIELGLIYKARSLSLDTNFEEVEKYFETLKSVNLPKVLKAPYIEIFSRIVKTMGSRRPNNYDLRVEKLIDLFSEYLGDFTHPWHFRLFLRLHMSVLKKYENELYEKSYVAFKNDTYDTPTAKFNLLHLYNYYNINNVRVDNSFIDKTTMESLENHPSTLLLQSTKDSIDSRPVNRKKIGIIVAGQIRGIKSNQLNLVNTDGFEFDIFISCWEKKGFKIPYNLVAGPYYRIFDKDIVDIFYSEGILGNQLYQRYPSIERLLLEGSFVNEELIKQHQWLSSNINYSIKSVTTYSEDEDVLKYIFDKYDLKQMPNNAMNNQLKMFYMNYCGYQALCNEEVNQQENYDYIIKVRPDLEVTIDIVQIMEELKNKQAVSADVLRPYDCGDRIAVGNRVIMGQYLRMFENLNIYQNDPRTMFGCGIFKAHAPIDYQIVSSGGQVYRSQYVEHGNYIELDLVERDVLVEAMLQDAKARGIDNIDNRIFESLGIHL